jgi:class 3 adenylate cyclase
MTALRLQYIVLADLVGSTKFTARMGNDMGIARMREFEDAAREALVLMKPPTSGKIVKAEGDGVLLVFDHFPDIVHWNFEFHDSLQTKRMPDGTFRLRMGGRVDPMKARIWVHIGEVHLEENDVRGLAVNELHKIEQAAKPNAPEGAVILTHLARDLAITSLYPKQCKLRRFDRAKLEGRPLIRLYQLVVKADIAFVRDRQLRAGMDV